MFTIRFRAFVLSSALVALLSIGSTAFGQINSIYNADVQNYFGAMNDTVQLGDLAALVPWPIGVNGPYPITGAASVPTPSALPLYPAFLPSSNSFAGGAYSSILNDVPSSTFSQGTIQANAPGGSNVVDGNVSVNMDLWNPNTAFAYHQMNFELIYDSQVVNLGAGIAGAPTFFVSGSTGTGASYAQFGAHIEYFWQDVNSSGALSGIWVPLGFLDYTASFGPNTTFFGVPVNPTTSSTLISPPTNFGLLAIVGETFVAGDPAEIHVSNLPEPSSLTLAVLGALGLVAVARRRMKNRPVV